MERTLVLIKHDALQRGLSLKILARFEEAGLKISGLKMFVFDQRTAEQWYAEHQGKGFYQSLIRYIMAGPVIAAVFEGPNAVAKARQIMGATNPSQAAAGSIRADFGITVDRNLLDGSDAVEVADREITWLFKSHEVHEWTRDMDRWLFEPPEQEPPSKRRHMPRG